MHMPTRIRAPRAVKWLLPRRARRALMRQVKLWSAWPRIGRVDFGDLRRPWPICNDWGFSRGTPIDRYYTSRFVSRHARDIRGRILEVGTNELTMRYRGMRVTHSDVLHVVDTVPPVTIVGDLTTGTGIPAETFDCVIATQTLQFIYDVHAVVRTLHRILKPAGVVLLTVPGITRISLEDMERWGQYWSFTSRSARQLFEEAFPREAIHVETYGNVCAATAFLQGVAAEELTEGELDHADRLYEMLVCVRAVKPAKGSAA